MPFEIYGYNPPDQMAAKAHNIVAINPSSLHIVYLWHDAGRVRTCPPGYANFRRGSCVCRKNAPRIRTGSVRRYTICCEK